MNRMMPASRTKLLRLQAFGIFPLVLGRGVISFLAVRTLQSNDISHKNSKGPQKSRKVSKTLFVNFVPFVANPFLRPRYRSRFLRQPFVRLPGSRIAVLSPAPPA